MSFGRVNCALARVALPTVGETPMRDTKVGGYVKRLEWLAECETDLRREAQDKALPGLETRQLIAAADFVEKVIPLCNDGSLLELKKAEALLERFREIGKLEQPFREVAVGGLVAAINSL